MRARTGSGAALAAALLWALGMGAAFALAQDRAEELRLKAGRGVVIDYPADITRISTSNPDIVDAVAVSTREVLLNARAAGAATVIVWGKTGPRTVYTVSVEPNVEPLEQALKQAFPAEDIAVHVSRDSIALSGKVSGPAVAERALALAAGLAKTVVNNLTFDTEPERQVLLRVKFAEVNRSAALAFGVNLVSTGVLNTPGGITTGQFAAPQASELAGAIPGRLEGSTSKFSIADALNVFAFRPDLNLAAFIKALESEGVLQILAEPNLVATNGKEASFLVGGEFPVPIVQGGASSGAITVSFREFGIRLAFLPHITGHNTIRMHVKPEVSTIDLGNAVVLSGFTIPALSSRRMETDIELEQGQSFAIAGLLDDRVTETLSRIPGLAHIPVLGALFRSRQEKRTKTELVVVVTPEIATPSRGGPREELPKMPRPFLPPLPAPAAGGGGSVK